MNVVHHTGSRQTCHGCGNRVFAYATTAAGAHYCRTCAHRADRVPLCRFCQRPVDGHPATNHPAEPERNPS